MKKIILIIVLSFLVLIPNITHAGFLDNLNCITNQGEMCDLTDAITGLKSLIDLLFGAMGAFALIYFVYGAIWWLTSGGNADKIKRGKDIMIGTITAIFIVFTSSLVITFYLDDILGVTYPTEDQLMEVGCVSEWENNSDNTCGGKEDCFGFDVIPYEAQCKDMSPSLQAMLSCIDGKLTDLFDQATPPDTPPIIEKEDVIITSISDNTGLGKCRDSWDNSCIHEEGSCHYGGSVPQINGSYAMDFRWIDLDAQQRDELANIVSSCGGSYEVRINQSNQSLLHTVMGCNDLTQ